MGVNYNNKKEEMNITVFNDLEKLYKKQLIHLLTFQRNLLRSTIVL